MAESTVKRMVDVELAFGPQGGLLAWPRDTKTLEVVPLDRTGLPVGAPQVVELSLAHGLSKIVPVGDRYFVLTMQFCPDRLVKIGSDHCAFARVLDGAGRPLGAELLTKLGPYGYWQVMRASADEVVAARTDPARAIIELLRYHIAPDGELRTEVVETFHRDEWGLGHDFNAGVCDVVDDHQVVVSADSVVSHFSTVEHGAKQLVGLVPDAYVHRCQADEGGVAVIFSRLDLPNPRRHFARFGPDGRLREAPRVLKVGVPAPAPFVESVVADVSFTTAEGAARWRRKALLHRRLEPLGAEVGQETVIAADIGLKSGAAVAWNGERFVVAYADFQAKGWRLRLSKVDCTPATTTP